MQMQSTKLVTSQNSIDKIPKIRIENVQGTLVDFLSRRKKLNFSIYKEEIIKQIETFVDNLLWLLKT